MSHNNLPVVVAHSPTDSSPPLENRHALPHRVKARSWSRVATQTHPDISCESKIPLRIALSPNGERQRRESNGAPGET